MAGRPARKSGQGGRPWHRDRPTAPLGGGGVFLRDGAGRLRRFEYEYEYEYELTGVRRYHTIGHRRAQAHGILAADLVHVDTVHERKGQNHLRSRTTTSVSFWGPAVFGTPYAGVAGPHRRPGHRSPPRDR